MNEFPRPEELLALTGGIVERSLGITLPPTTVSSTIDRDVILASWKYIHGLAEKHHAEYVAAYGDEFSAYHDEYDPARLSDEGIFRRLAFATVMRCQGKTSILPDGTDIWIRDDLSQSPYAFTMLHEQFHNGFVACAPTPETRERTIVAGAYLAEANRREERVVDILTRRHVRGLYSRVGLTPESPCLVEMLSSTTPDTSETIGVSDRDLALTLIDTFQRGF